MFTDARRLRLDRLSRLLVVASLLLSAVLAFPQNEKEQPRTRQAQLDPPGQDVFIPFVPVQSATEKARAEQFDNVEQIKILAEINKLTVELVKRRSDRYQRSADSARLVSRLKELTKQLHQY
jgi:hypothetical protein